MANWNTFLRYNTYLSKNPINIIRVAYDLLTSRFQTVKKQNIYHLSQAEDKTIDFTFTIDGEKINDVTRALFLVSNLDGTERFRYTLEDNISFADSVFSIALKDSETASMTGKYIYELWMQDSNDAETLMFKGALKFHATSGRF